MRLIVTGIVLLTMVGPTLACSFSYPEGYVAPPVPTVEERIAASHAAFIGTVVGIRDNRGEVLTHLPDCDQPDAEANCWAYLDSLLTAILVVEEPIRGVAKGGAFETLAGYPTSSCNEYALEIGRRYLVVDRWNSETPALLAEGNLAAWRAIGVHR